MGDSAHSAPAAMSVIELTPAPAVRPPGAQPLYRMLADHYLGAMRSGVLTPGQRMPSVRTLMRTHSVSLSTALQVCRHLEAEGWLEARERSGYFVRQPAARPRCIRPLCSTASPRRCCARVRCC